MAKQRIDLDIQYTYFLARLQYRAKTQCPKPTAQKQGSIAAKRVAGKPQNDPKKRKGKKCKKGMGSLIGEQKYPRKTKHELPPNQPQIKQKETEKNKKRKGNGRKNKIRN